MIGELLYPLLILSAQAETSLPISTPIFLKQGFSTVLEFREAPTKVVLGDATSFQIEKLDASIAIKPLAPYATTDMLVYFKKETMRLFILSAADEAVPTLFKSYKENAIPASSNHNPSRVVGIVRNLKLQTGLELIAVMSDKKKDYVTVDFWVSSSEERLIPEWNSLRLNVGPNISKPSKVWSERREVQIGTSVKARAIFTRPDLSLTNASLSLPLLGKSQGLSLNLGGKL